MKVFLAGNSQATSLGVEQGQSYAARLRDLLGDEHELHALVVSGWTIRDFNEHVENVLLARPDVVVLQIGIVECSRRILSTLEKRVLYRLPGGNRATKFLHDRRQRVVRARARVRMDTRLFAPAEFDRELSRFAATVGVSGSELVIVEIPCFDDEYERRWFPLINEDIELFNGVLRRYGAVPLFEGGVVPPGLWQPGTVHFTEEGHRLVAQRMLERIRSNVLVRS